MPADADFWDRYFRHYDALDEVPTYRELLERVAYLCSLDDNSLVLDAGAGTGNLAYRLRRQGHRVVALDLNPRGLVRARGKHSAIACVAANLEEPLPLRGSLFDAVASVNVLYTLSDEGRARCLVELRRVLKPGGRLVVSVPVAGARPAAIYIETVRRWLRSEGLVGAALNTFRLLPPSVAILAYNARIRRRAREGTYRFFGRSELLAVLEDAGFGVEDVEKGYAGQAWIARAKAPS